MPMQGMPFPGMQMQGVPYGMPPQYMMQSMGMHPHAFPPFATGVMGMTEPVQPTAGGKLRRKRRKQEKGGPKKPATAFVMFSNEKRDTVKAENPGISFTDIGRKLGEMWREMEPDVKKDYETRAMTAKDKYMLEKKAWLENKEKGGDAAEEKQSSPGGADGGHLGMSVMGTEAQPSDPGQTGAGEDDVDEKHSNSLVKGESLGESSPQVPVSAPA